MLAASADIKQVVIFMVFGVPESPRYLYKEGRNEEALQVLCDVYDGTPDDPKIAREQKDILDALALERVHGEYKYESCMIQHLKLWALTKMSAGGAKSSSVTKYRLEDVFFLPMACSL